jgi:uncharacterized protein (TIGR02466 family)
MIYESWFANPIGVDFVKEIDNTALREFCLSLKNKEAGRTISNAGGWQSKNLDFNTPELQELLQAIWVRLLQMKDSIGIKDSVPMSITDIWVNINGKGNFNRPHAHPQSVISGVYYVDADPAISGDIVFQNPIVTHGYHWDKNWFKEGVNETISSSSCYYKPETTKIILFPGWLWHYVEPSNSDKTRISIAFNTGVEPDVRD